MLGYFEIIYVGIKFKYEYGGFLDYGFYYVVNIFYDVKLGCFIVYGWLLEEDLFIIFVY